MNARDQEVINLCRKLANTQAELEATQTLLKDAWDIIDNTDSPQGKTPPIGIVLDRGVIVGFVNFGNNVHVVDLDLELIWDRKYYPRTTWTMQQYQDAIAGMNFKFEDVTGNSPYQNPQEQA